MSAKIAVLGLVIEEPGPAYRLTAKMRQRLASAEFVDSNVYSALGRLERDGLVRASTIEPAEPPRRRLSAAGEEPEQQTPDSRSDSREFEATPAGIRHFEQWLLASSPAPPLRDELHMKVALCQPRNVPRLVELVYGQELVCLGRVQELKRSFERVRAPEPDRWSGLLLVHVRDAELSFWDARLTWLQSVRQSLERIHAEFERATRRGPGA
jgi:DNA-binding PadR family transcriptional regulator